MNLSPRMPAGKWFAIALCVCGWSPPTSVAGVILTPDSILGPPVSTLPAVHGSAVPAGGIVGDRYSGLGLLFQNSAVTEINGVKVWAPTGDTATLDGTSLYFGAGATIFGGFNAPGDPNTPGTVGSAIFELIGVPVGEALVGGFNADAELKVLTGNNNENLVGPNGGILAILASDSLAMFAVTYPTWEDTPVPTAPWGIASIEIDDVVVQNDPSPVNDAPEPGTLVLSCLGAAGLAGYRWRRSSMSRP